MSSQDPLHRRDFLRFIAASPAVAFSQAALAQGLPNLYAPERISRADQAINVFDFHEVAKEVLSPAHYTYMAMGTDDGGTLRANREGFRDIKLRVRRLVNTRSLDTTLELFGRRYPVPIMLAPCGTHKAFHPDGEPAVKRAAHSRQVEWVLSSVASTSIEAVNALDGRPAWFQLYTSADWDVNLARAKRAEAAGSPVLVLTVDLPDSNREAVARFRRGSNAECQACHQQGTGIIPPKPMIGRESLSLSHLDWEFVDRLKRSLNMKLVIKGIVTTEDAALAVEHDVDGVIVSNHGGRSEDSGRSTIECLPEVVDTINGRMPVICDSGFRRGTDIFKALAIGADAIAIGRPYLWGLSAFSQQGVETVIDILSRELEIVMRQAGVTSIDQISRQHIV